MCLLSLGKFSALMVRLKLLSLPLVTQHRLFTTTISRNQNELSTRGTVFGITKIRTYFIINSSTLSSGRTIIKTVSDQKAAELFYKTRPQALKMRVLG